MLIFRPISERGRIDSRNFIGLKSFRKFIKSALLSPKKEVRLSQSTLGRFQNMKHQVGSIDPIGQFFFLRKLSVDRPDERHAIGADQIELSHCVPKRRIVSSESKDMSVRRFNGIGTIPRESSLGNPSDGSLIVRHGHRKAENKTCRKIVHSRLTETECPCNLRRACCFATSISLATISEHISSTVISGIQPSSFFAFDGSPRSVSTSAGRK